MCNCWRHDLFEMTAVTTVPSQTSCLWEVAALRMASSETASAIWELSSQHLYARAMIGHEWYQVAFHG